MITIVLAVALAVCGCSGGSGTATPTPTPTPGPGGYVVGTPTPGASAPSSLGQLYNANAIKSYSYRLTSVISGQTTVSNYAIGYTDATYNGVPAKHVSMTFDAPATGGAGTSQISVDLYTSKADNTTLGGHMKMVANGQTIIDMDIPAGQASTYTSNDLAASSGASAGSQLINQGTETVTIDGKPYSCTKYGYTASDITYTVWYTPQAPMPVKTTWTDKSGNTYTMELTSWS